MLHLINQYLVGARTQGQTALRLKKRSLPRNHQLEGEESSRCHRMKSEYQFHDFAPAIKWYVRLKKKNGLEKMNYLVKKYSGFSQYILHLNEVFRPLA